MFREVTKINHRFRSSRGIFQRVNTSFIFTVFLLFTSYHSTKMTPLFNGENAICLPTVISAFHHFSKKANKVFKRWRVLGFYRIALCLTWSLKLSMKDSLLRIQILNENGDKESKNTHVEVSIFARDKSKA